MKSLFNSKALLGVVVYFIHICCSAGSFDPDTLRLNLALFDPGSTTTIQGNKSYDKVVLENVINGYAYSVEIRNEQKLLPPLESTSGLQKAFVGLSPDCNKLKTAFNAVEQFQEDIDNTGRMEKDLGELTHKLDVLISAKKCDNSQVEESARFWLNSTKRVLDQKVDIESGKVVTIIIKRSDLEWKFVFEGDSPGKWTTTYGFGFTFNAFRGSTYFARNQSDTTNYIILKSRGPRLIELSYVPAVFFTFFPSKRQSKCWNNSLTGGLGFDLQAPVVYLGYNGLYWHNIGFSAGIAFQQQNVLKDKYALNQEVNDFLDTGELHDKVYRPNIFISLHFRLDKNPFSKEESGGEK